MKIDETIKGFIFGVFVGFIIGATITFIYVIYH